jgi:hypothetical protein
VRAAIVDKVRRAMMTALAPELTGTRSVRLAVRVHEVNIASAIQRVFIGGDHRIEADVDLVDAKTGAPLLSLPSHRVTAGAGGGVLGVALDNLILSDPIDRATALFAADYRNWLLRK